MRCLYCKGKIPFDAKSCPHCLKSLDIQSPEKCPVCGGYWRDGDFECRWCYTRLRWLMQEDLLQEDAIIPDSSGAGDKNNGLVGTGLKRRFLATLLDGLAAMFFLTLIRPGSILGLGGLSRGALMGYWSQYADALILTLLLWLLYYIAFEGLLGWTPGKIFAGLRVVQTDGSRTGLVRAAVRNLYRIIDGLFFYLIGALLISRSPLHQRLGDMAAGTLVIEKAALEETERPPSSGDNAI